MKHLKTSRFFFFSLLFFSSLAHAGDSTTDLSSRLQKIVEINSGSKNSNGVSKVQNWLRQELKAMNFEVETAPGQLLVANLKGKQDKTIVILVHADTVFEPSQKFTRFSKSKDLLTATGPGVIDDKGGIIVALEGLKRYLKAETQPGFNLKFVSSPSEEIGSPGLLETYKSISEKAWMVLGFEPALEDGSIVSSRNGNKWYLIKAVGKEAHAGRAHREGANACHALSAALTEISELTDYDNGVTVSIGHFEGGQDKFNIVCGSASAKVDVRFADLKGQKRVHEKIQKILKKTWVPGTQLSYELVDDCPPVSVSRESEKILAEYLKAIEGVEGKAVTASHSKGAGDINYFSRPGLIAIDGLGPVGGKMHTTDEFIVLSSLESRAEAMSKFLQKLSK